MRGIGDRVEEVLTRLGVTPERVSQFIGKPCGCEERKRKLNQLGWWALRVLQGKAVAPISELDAILEDVNDE